MKNINCREARQIPIADYLKKLGFSPAYTRGNDFWYCSPLREENHASFKVNTKLNIWYDHGIGEGGTMIDLGIKLHECSIEELLKKLSSDERSFSFHQPKLMSDLNYLNNLKQEEESRIIIYKVAELKSSALTGYLDQRGISQDTAKRYCKEVSFTIKDKSYRAIGFENRSGGYELRSGWFKGSSSPKDITFLNNGSKSVCLVEGFIDFLSLLQLKKQAHLDTNFLILNSVNLLSKSIDLLQKHQEVFLYLDNDKAGKETAEKLKRYGIESIDSSGFYQRFKDINEYLVAQKDKLMTPSFCRR
ncbi:toprim domain-containing protein [uncultured Mucilaginibacter sp.]|uniref:toprim domain-containing protein n=1 Tax=uncultured Mucilaginibacter sp. TaxID=797541 RepID=UPI00261F61D4|nr:toprim domain-containing protein [uncultured Mucilaginibacter sp.]